MKVSYTVSDIRGMVDQAVLSIKSVRKFFQRNEVVVFYTPPRSEKNRKRLSALAEVREVENLTDPFDPWGRGRMSRYGEKVHLCSLDDEEVFFLDADTRVRGDLRGLLEGDFDVALRRDDWVNDRVLNWDKWRAMFKRIGKEPINVPDAGFIIFKNGTHRDIRDEWLRLLNSDLENPGTSYLKDCYSLALAVSGRRIRWLNPMECSHTYANEPEATYVVHLGHTTIEKQNTTKERIPLSAKDRLREGLFRNWAPEKRPEKWLTRMPEDVLKETSPKGKVILDAGTGKGRFAIAFAKGGAERVSAVDISPLMLKLAHGEAEREGVSDKIVFEVGDVESLEYPDNYFDIACCMQTIMHLPYPLRAISELKRVCKEGGKVVVDASITKGPKQGDCWKDFTEEEFLKLFEENGLKVEQERKYSAEGVETSTIMLVAKK